MIEILVLMSLRKKLAKMAEEKGRSTGWGMLGILLWLVGEFTGALIGFSMDMGSGAYALALGCALAGGLIAYLVVKSIGPGGMVAAYAATPNQVTNPNYDPTNPYGPPKNG